MNDNEKLVAFPLEINDTFQIINFSTLAKVYGLVILFEGNTVPYHTIADRIYRNTPGQDYKSISLFRQLSSKFQSRFQKDKRLGSKGFGNA